MAAKRLFSKSSRKPDPEPADVEISPGGDTVDRQVEQIRRVIEVMVAAGAVEVELEEQGSKLRVRLKEEPRAAASGGGFAAPMLPNAAGGARGEPAASSLPPPVARGEVFKSPMVGTFYRAAAPDAEPFVRAGDHVTADSVLCIIEAMKVMNEIKAEIEGEVVEVLTQNGEPVDYGQPLFVIKV